MAIQKYIFAIVCLAVATTSYAGTENYEHVGERPAAGRVDTAYYSFEYSAPNKVYDSISWNAYGDKTEKRNSVMVTGLSGYDTYALNVLYKGNARAGQSALDVAREQYPSLSLSTGPNPSCVNTSLDQPFQLDRMMLNFLALCIDNDSNSIYELNISWRSLLLAMQSPDTMAKESEECSVAKAQDSATRCSDYFSDYAQAYKKFLSSFKMTGK